MVAQAIQQERDFVPVGGPQTLTQIESARAAFAVLDQPANIARLPDGLRRLALRLLPYVTPKHVRGPAQFFLTAMGMDMVGPCYGTKRFGAFFAGVVQSGTQGETPPTAAPGDGSVT